jgi:excisionase family DNA binding protein
MYATNTVKTAKKTTESTQEMKNDKYRVPSIAGSSTGESVGVGHWKTIDFPASDRVRPPCADRESYCAKENPMMELTSPVNPLAEILGRLLPLLPLAERWLEKQVGEAEVVPEPERMLTPKEASVLLKLHVQTVMAWCREGKLDAVKIGGNKVNGKGGKFLIPREAIDAYIAQQRLIHGSRKGGAK